jgi:hypothetical protein
VLVRTKGGGWGSRSSGGGDRTWLLIKHRDDWSGPVDIAEFAPLSVKSNGDFADILATENPEIWHSHRPAQGGEAGAMFERIIARALEMRDERVKPGSAGEADGTAAKRSTQPKAAGGAAARGTGTKATPAPRVTKTAKPAARKAAKSAAVTKSKSAAAKASTSARPRAAKTAGTSKTKTSTRRTR